MKERVDLSVLEMKRMSYKSRRIYDLLCEREMEATTYVGDGESAYLCGLRKRRSDAYMK